VLAAIGFGIVLVRITGRAALAIATAICIGLFGVSMLIGGAFPMPNPLHGAFGLAFALVPAPVLMALALRRVPGLRGLRNLLWVNAVLMACLLAVMMGVGGLVTLANVGLWQRANALTMFPWIGIAAWWLLRASAEPVRRQVATGPMRV
jgi:hypothetical protein